MNRLVHLVTDRGAGDPGCDVLATRLVRGLPGAVVHITSVAPCDTLAAGFCVGQLALATDRPPRLVAHDVAAASGDPDPWPPGADERFCLGRSVTGALVVGANVGWAWSFAVDELCGLCAVDVPAAGRRSAPDRVASAIAHVSAGHPHAVGESVPRSQVPRLPGIAIAHVDARGNLKTTITALPAAAGTRVRVRVGDVSASAIVSDGSVAVAAGDLVLLPASSDWPAADGRTPGYLELLVRGGSAAERFASPRSGTPIVVSSS
jgi:hypothetical protein